MDAIKAKSVEIHIIELFKSMSNVQKVLQVIEKVYNGSANHVEISILQLLWKRSIFGLKCVEMTPHNMTIPHILRGHTIF